MMRIHREHCLGKDEARKRVGDVADEMCSKFGLNAAWAGDELKIQGNGVDGCIAVTEQSVDMEVRLGLPYSMMSSTIRTSIENMLDEHLEMH